LKTVSFDPREPSIRIPVVVETARTVAKYLFVVDTGATRSAIHSRIAKALKLAPDPTRVAAVTTASGHSTAGFFIVPDLWDSVSNKRITGSSLKNSRRAFRPTACSAWTFSAAGY
jgi:Aspartyl protease